MMYKRVAKSIFGLRIKLSLGFKTRAKSSSHLQTLIKYVFLVCFIQFSFINEFHN